MVTRTMTQLAAILALLACAWPAVAQQPVPAPETPKKAPPAAVKRRPVEIPPAAAPPSPDAAAPEVTPAPSATPPGAAAEEARPRAHHAPVTVANEAEPIVIEASFEHPELVRSAVVVFQPQGGAQSAAPFERGALAYVATIPASAVRAPGIGYTIEIEHTDGRRIAAYGTRAELSPIQVAEDRDDARRNADLRRLGNRTSIASASAEYVAFGNTQGTRALPCAEGAEGCAAGTSQVPSVQDQYYRVEVGYTYRPLTTIAQFSLRGGVIRGTSLVPTDTLDYEKYEVGINYGAPTVTFRLSDSWHLETELLASITEVGFSVGAGSALLIGDPYGTRLALGFETIGIDPDTYFGSRFYTRLEIVATERVTLGPGVEVTDNPHAESFGVRLLAAGNVDLGRGFGVSARGGYQARKSTSGGPSFGGGLYLAF
jgi:hypothetical protein